MTVSTNDLPTAGLIRRLMAMVYDGLLLLGVAFAYGVVVTIVRVSILGADELEYVNIPFVFHLLSWGTLWAILAGYYVLCWTKRGQTLGMKSWRLCLQTPEGYCVEARTAWLRCLLAQVSLLAAGLGYVWVLFDNRGCWHDRWSRTRVVMLPKEKRRPAHRDPKPLPPAG